MNAMKKNNKTKRLPMPKKVRKGFMIYVAVIMAAVFMFSTFSLTAFAASDPLSAIDNLSDFIFGLIRAIGLILLGLGIVQVGLSFKSHDPSQRANGFLTLAGGVVITFAKEILTQPDYRIITNRGMRQKRIPHNNPKEVQKCLITGLFKT